MPIPLRLRTPRVHKRALIEVRVHASLLCRDTRGRVVHEQGIQQIEAIVVEAGNGEVCVVALPFGERGLEVWEAGDAGPVELGRGAEDAEDFEYLINLAVAGKEGLAGAHLGEDAANGPHVDAGAVGAAAEEDFRGAVPECDNLGRVLVRAAGWGGGG